MTTALVAVVAALALAALVGWLLTRRAGSLQAVGSEVDTTDLGLSRDGPTVVHFSAAWCAPCDRVRRVVSQVCRDLEDLGDVAHVEIDMDANPAAARRLSVLSLPTTFIFDGDGRQRYRTAGVPSAADLRSALTPLLA
ncbi:thioredoxin family protein [Mycobacterium branderi]|uniref:Thiol reductase thioredoxin n=1 Tax=Mycobacterium branderi TaxID=43348 RepID=A0A7I7W529_9MYCO|nr:thioredoxin family protein [Mycobacterium branderi]MCV7234048.1 thioredoxin family protein [Mycobacterium branderi]ORA39434.1 thiol reductase thioredoxin [Mycobacterium branderi]BBZ12022.1 thiol reductase thioredoxin [Mycobacterium branderi]